MTRVAALIKAHQKSAMSEIKSAPMPTEAAARMSHQSEVRKCQSRVRQPIGANARSTTASTTSQKSS
jgi:hypothetical protein